METKPHPVAIEYGPAGEMVVVLRRPDRWERLIITDLNATSIARDATGWLVGRSLKAIVEG